MTLSEWLVRLDKIRDDIIKLAVDIQDLEQNDKVVAEHLFNAKFEVLAEMIMVASMEKAGEKMAGKGVN